jgi:tetratricopeptide (TPR) repeat protein
MFWGPTPARELLEWLEQNEHERRTGRRHRLQLHRAGALAMSGATDDAVAVVESLREELRDRGRMTELAMTGHITSIVARLAGDPERAERYLVESCAFLEERHEQSVMSTGAALLALALIELGRFEEAEGWATKAFESAAPDDMFTHLPARRARALLLSARSDHEAAERAAREALELAETTDLVHDQAQAHEALARVLAAAGSPGAPAELERAAEIYARKGDVVSEHRVRELLANSSAV